MNNIYFFSMNIGSEWDNYNLYHHIKTPLSFDDLVLELHQKAVDYININKPSILWKIQFNKLWIRVC